MKKNTKIRKKYIILSEATKDVFEIIKSINDLNKLIDRWESNHTISKEGNLIEKERNRLIAYRSLLSKSLIKSIEKILESRQDELM